MGVFHAINLDVSCNEYNFILHRVLFGMFASNRGPMFNVRQSFQQHKIAVLSIDI